jgi:hypothetical protein
MIETDLTLVATDDLLKEISGRFDAAVFMGYKNATSDHSHSMNYWLGEPHLCLGLCAILQHKIAAQREDESCDDEDGGIDA